MKKIILSIFCLFAGVANAGIIYDNGSTVGGGVANEATSWVQADNFTLASDVNITGGAIWIESQGGPLNWDGTIDYWFFDNNAGSPGSVLQSGSASTSLITDTGIFAAQGGQDNIQMVNFDLDSIFSAVSSIDYHFGVQLGSVSTAWSGYTPGNGVESAGGTFDNWANNGRERAFYFENAGQVPEPASIALLGLGLAGLGFSRKKKRI